MSIEDQSPPATIYQRPLHYSANGPHGGFVFMFREGVWNCSERAEQYPGFCHVAPTDMNIVSPQVPGFVYLDCGAWVDNADGKGTRRRNFGLICGPHVYLCEFVGTRGIPPSSSVPSVQRLFEELAGMNCIVNVVKYVNASKCRKAKVNISLKSSTLTDPTLYLIMPDFHMPPAGWFAHDSDGFHSSAQPPPAWLQSTPAFQRGQHWSNWLALIEDNKKYGRYLDRRHPADIFVTAGADLSLFLRSLSRLTPQTKALLHFIHLGDMFELWLGRNDYQFQPGDHNPRWVSSDSVRRVSDWAMEVMIQNAWVFDAFKSLESAGLAEVKYLWGNHDAYLKDPELACGQLGIPQRDPVYLGLNGDLFVEHGHRFDRSNYDELSNGFFDFNGPEAANWAFYQPVVRQAEKPGRWITGAGHPQERICYLHGASLAYLWLRRSERRKFGIYVMGHTHDPQLFVFRILTEYQIYKWESELIDLQEVAG